MWSKVVLFYFRPHTGALLGHIEAPIETQSDTISAIWEEVHELRRIGRLPGLRPNAGRDLIIMVDVPQHPERVLHLVMPPSIEEEDNTPVRVPTGEMTKISRTSTQDFIRPPDTEPGEG